jgi:hypothetical protein
MLPSMNRSLISGLFLVSTTLIGCGLKNSSSTTNSDASVVSDNGKLSLPTHTPGKGTVRESDLGLPLYPGADPGDQTIESDKAGDSKIKIAQFSPDEPEKVIAFYKRKLKAARGTIQIVRNTSSAVLTAMGFDGMMANGKDKLTVNAVRKKSKTSTEIKISVAKFKAK